MFLFGNNLKFCVLNLLLDKKITVNFTFNLICCLLSDYYNILKIDTQKNS